MITIGLLIAFAVGLALANSALVTASLLLITHRLKPQRILKKVDWNLLVMFSGLYILSKVTQKLNLIQPLTQTIDTSAGLIASIIAHSLFKTGKDARSTIAPQWIFDF